MFEDLLPSPHNTVILKLIFRLSHWHGLAKLRLHSDLTLDILDTETTYLGDALRTFKNKTCAAFQTREFKREVDSRKKKAVKKTAPGGSSASNTTSNNETPKNVGPAADSEGRAFKAFSLKTYKAHALGDYVDIIKRIGTSDSFSSETVSLFLGCSILVIDNFLREN